ncbi:UapC protein [Balamuthia mandrillaris]
MQLCSWGLQNDRYEHSLHRYGVTQCVCNSGWTGRLCEKLFARRYYSKPICTLDGHCVCPPHSDLCQHGGNYLFLGLCGSIFPSLSAHKHPFLCLKLTKESPDLVPSLHRFRPYVEWQTFPECHCAVDAGCTKPGHRKLLRFPMRTDNIGNADLLIGDPGDYLDKYVWHICHNHPHFDHFSEFTLRHKTLTNLTAHGFKSGSTVVDSYRWDRGTPFNAVRQYNEKHQGIQAGWADIYPASLDCQWIDVTDLPLGDYVLELVTNPLQLIHESNYDNNKVTFDIQCDPPCVHGQCDFGHSCVCGEGWQGVACDEQADVHHCIPHCGEKDCGPDGCGGSCGSCQTGQHCTVSGACVCTPSCIAKECGPDGCGGTGLVFAHGNVIHTDSPTGVCGECSSLESCNSNQRCMRTCVASCQGRECGPDGCGGTCGGCPEGRPPSRLWCQCPPPFGEQR